MLTVAPHPMPPKKSAFSAYLIRSQSRNKAAGIFTVFLVLITESKRQSLLLPLDGYPIDRKKSRHKNSHDCLVPNDDTKSKANEEITEIKRIPHIRVRAGNR